MTEAFDGGTSAPAGSDSPVDTSSQQPAGQQSTQQETVNPAWEPLLNELPEYFHPKAKSHFKTWDENYNKLQTEHKGLQERYAPYEPYVGVQPEAIQYALGVLDQINKDPMKVYEALTKHVTEMGLLQSGQQQSPQDEQMDLGQDPQYSELDRRTNELDQRQQQFDAYLEQQAYNQQVQTFEGQIDQQVQAVTAKYGAAVDTQDLLQRIFVQVQQGKPFDAEAAFQEQKETFQRLYSRQGQTARQAPNVIPTTGTPAPSGEVKPEDMNEDQRKAYFKHLLDIANSGG
jgi:hypothetical protein